jgi:formylglycine-generating enzyme required for sulfatase activity
MTPERYRALVSIDGLSIDGDWGGIFPKGRRVVLSPFAIGKYEVTWELWHEVVEQAEAHGCRFTAESGYQGHEPAAQSGTGKGTSSAAWTEEERRARPVTYVSVRDIVVWCNAYSELDGLEPVYRDARGSVVRQSAKVTEGTRMDMTKSGYRLPTEAEWEAAARGADSSAPDWTFTYAGQRANSTFESNAARPGKTTLTVRGLDGPYEAAWWQYNASRINSPDGRAPNNADYGAHPVGTKAPNRLGLYDMTGNAWEYCWDYYYPDPCAGDPRFTVDGVVKDPAGPVVGEYRTYRGGAWPVDELRQTIQTRYGTNGDLEFRAYNLGFRVVRRRDT